MGIAGVLGSAVLLDDLVAVSGRPLLDVLGAVREAVAVGVLDDEGEVLSFRHDLLRAEVYDGLAPAVRKGVHLQAARRLAERGAPAATVAHHFAHGASPGDAEAVGWLRRAAAAASAESPTIALELLDRALRLSVGDRQRLQVRVARLRPLAWTGRAADAAAEADAILQERRHAADVVVALRASSAYALSLLDRIDEAVDRLARSAEDGALPAATRATLFAEIAALRAIGGDRSRASAAIAASEALGGPAAGDAAAVLLDSARGVIELVDCRPEEAIEHLDQAVRCAVGSEVEGVPERAPLQHLGLALIAADRSDEAEQLLLAGRRADLEVQRLAFVPSSHMLLAHLKFLRGEWDDAVAEAEAAIAAGVDSGSRVGRSWPARGARPRVAAPRRRHPGGPGAGGRPA